MADLIDTQEDQTKVTDAVVTAPEEPTSPAPEGDAEPAPVKEPAAEAPKEGEAESEESKEHEDKPAEPAQSEDDEAARKARNSEMARRRIEDKKKLEQQFAQTVDTNYAPKTKEEFVDEGLDEVQAEVQALRQEVQFDKTRTYLAELNSGLKVDAQRVLSEFDLFDPSSPQYDAEFANRTQQRYERIARLEKTKLDDGSEIVTRAEEPLYDFFAEEVANYNRGKEQGQTTGQQDTLKMMSRSESPQNNSKPNTDKTADDMTIEEMEAKYGIVRR